MFVLEMTVFLHNYSAIILFVISLQAAIVDDFILSYLLLVCIEKNIVRVKCIRNIALHFSKQLHCKNLYFLS